jgi:hypothetical protein
LVFCDQEGSFFKNREEVKIYQAMEKNWPKGEGIEIAWWVVNEKQTNQTSESEFEKK